MELMGKQKAEVPPGRKEIQSELGRMLASQTFKTRGRSRAFLRFVVEASLAGRRQNLKGYTIGVEVCGRPDDFDPQIDAIVRVEAGRLRKRLSHYYLTEGIQDPVLIRIPTGAYAPEFSYRAPRVDEPVSEAPGAPTAATPSAQPTAGFPRVAIAAPVAALLLIGFGFSVSRAHQKLDHVLDLQSEITQGIVGTTALGTTIATASTAAPNPPRSGSTMETEARTLYRQATALRDPAFDPVRSRLAELAYLRVIELDPDFAEAYAGLAYVLAFRSWWGLGENRHANTRRARSLALIAIDKGPELGWAHLSLGLALAVDGDHDAAAATAARATGLAPSDPNVHAFAGLIHLLAGDSDLAISQARQAIDLDPRSGRVPYRNILGIALFHAGRTEQALATLLENLELGGPDGPHMAYFRAAAHARLGRLHEAGLELERARSFRYPFDLIDALRIFRDPAIARQVTESLRLAGWQFGDAPAPNIRLVRHSMIDAM